MGTRHWIFFLVSIMTPLAQLSLNKRFGQFFASNPLKSLQVNDIFLPYSMPKFVLATAVIGTSPTQFANHDRANNNSTSTRQYFKLPLGINKFDSHDRDDSHHRDSHDSIAQYEKNRKILSRIFIIWLAVSLVLLLNAVNVIEIF